MGYYVRYFCESPAVPTPELLAGVLERESHGFRMSEDGQITKKGEVYAHVEINVATEDLFRDEIEEFRVRVRTLPPSDGRTRVWQCLENTSAIVAAQVLSGGGSIDETLKPVDILWAYLDEHYSGLSNADHEGFYLGSNLILDMSPPSPAPNESFWSRITQVFKS